MSAAYSDSGSSDEGDKPESISLSQSRKDAKSMDQAFQQVLTAEKAKKRQRNKERDQKLKEQAARSKKRKGEVQSDEVLGLTANEARQDVGMEEGDGNKRVDVEPNANAKHLPDHLFTSAFSKSATSKSATSASEHRTTNDRSRKARKRTHSSSKDILIGSRVVRKLASGATHPEASTIPSTKAKRFLDRSLALEGVAAKKQRWERRPVNIGVMRRDGPAANFVRKT